MSRIRAKSEAYARSDDSSSNKACARFDIVGAGGWGRDEEEDPASSDKSLILDAREGESGRPGSEYSWERRSESLLKSIDSKRPANDG